MKLKIILVIMCLAILACMIIIVSNESTIIELNEKLNYATEIKELLSDTVEIEKKWLIDKNKIPYDLSKVDDRVEIEQTYLNFSPEIRVRKYKDVKGKYSYEFTVKTNLREHGTVRDELNAPISEVEYDELILKKEGNTIQKTRYQIFDNNRIIAIDIFKGDLEGLAYMEIEFKNLEEANSFKTPDWVIKDVTSDVNYKNGHLARFGIPYIK